MSNYKPLVKTINASAVYSGTIVDAKLTATSWGLALIRGTAVFSNTVLASAGVQIWESGSPTTGAPDHTTFTDANGQYGVTVPAAISVIIIIIDGIIIII